MNYVNYAESITDAPIEFHNFMGIAGMGCVLGNKVHFPFGDTNIYPNIWIILLAPSSAYRKTTALNIIKRLLLRVDPALVYPNEFSHEKIQEILSQKPYGSFFFSEFITLMGLLNRDYMAGCKAFLADLFDCPVVYERQTKGNNTRIENPAVSIFSATTIEWFLEMVKETDIYGGFLPRFLIVPAYSKTKDMPIPPRVDQVKQKALIDELEEISKVSGEAYLTDGARKLHGQWYSRFSECADGTRFNAFYQRLQTYILKFAMIIQVSKNRGLEITEDSMQEAIGYMDWLSNNMRIIEDNELTFGKVQKDMKKVMGILRQRKTKGESETSRKDLLRATRLSSKELDNTTETLFEQEKIDISQKTVGDSHKRTMFYRLIEEA